MAKRAKNQAIEGKGRILVSREKSAWTGFRYHHALDRNPRLLGLPLVTPDAHLAGTPSVHPSLKISFNIAGFDLTIFKASSF